MSRLTISLYHYITISHHIPVDGVGVRAQPLDRLERREKSFQITPSTWHSQYDEDDGGGGDDSDDDYDDDDDSDDDDDGDDQAGNGVEEHGLGIPGSVKMGGSFRFIIIIIIIIITVIIIIVIMIVTIIVIM